MLSILSDTDRGIVETIAMRLSTKESLTYLKAMGFEMSERKYFRHKKRIQDMKLERMMHIAQYFPDQHLERIDQLEFIEKLCWQNYHVCKDPAKKVKILETIKEIQPYLSTYYGATKSLLEWEARDKRDKQQQEQKEKAIVSLADVNNNEVEAEAWTVDSNDPSTNTGTTTVTSQTDSLCHKDKDNVRDKDGWLKVQCPNCLEWFNSNVMLSLHECDTKI
jgi:nitroreductase